MVQSTPVCLMVSPASSGFFFSLTSRQLTAFRWTHCAHPGQGGFWSWGTGACGQLALGSATAAAKPTQAKVKLKGKAIKIACGYYHTAILTGQGGVDQRLHAFLLFDTLLSCRFSLGMWPLHFS